MKHRLTLASTILILALIVSFIPASASTFDRPVSFSTCNWAQFVADVTVPDGTYHRAGRGVHENMAAEKYRQLLMDNLLCAGVQLRHCDEHLRRLLIFPVVLRRVRQLIFPSIDCADHAGQYIGYWKLRDGSGNMFGIGWNANKSFWVGDQCFFHFEYFCI